MFSIFKQRSNQGTEQSIFTEVEGNSQERGWMVKQMVFGELELPRRQVESLIHCHIVFDTGS